MLQVPILGAAVVIVQDLYARIRQLPRSHIPLARVLREPGVPRAGLTPGAAVLGRQHVLLIAVPKYITHLRARLIFEPRIPHITITKILLLPYLLLISITRRPLRLRIRTIATRWRVSLPLRTAHLCATGGAALLEAVVGGGVLVRIRVWRLVVALEVGIVDHEVVVLGHVLLESEMLTQERKELLARPVVRKLLRANILMVQHHVEEGLAVAAPLHGLVHVEVQDAEWLYLLDPAGLAPNKQISLAHLYEPDNLLALTSNIEPVIRIK